MENELEELKASLEKLTTRRKATYEKYEKISNELAELHKKIDKVRSRIETIKMDGGFESFEDEANYYLFEDGHVSGARYKRRGEWLAKIGLESSGYNPKTEQIALRICLYKNDDEETQRQHDSLMKVMPYLKPSKDGIYIGIFENTLSEYGIYDLKVGDGQCKLEFTRYGSTSTLKTFDTLLDAMKFVQEEHYYQKTKGSYDD